MHAALVPHPLSVLRFHFITNSARAACWLCGGWHLTLTYRGSRTPPMVGGMREIEAQPSPAGMSDTHVYVPAKGLDLFALHTAAGGASAYFFSFGLSGSRFPNAFVTSGIGLSILSKALGRLIKGSLMLPPGFSQDGPPGAGQAPPLSGFFLYVLAYIASVSVQARKSAV